MTTQDYITSGISALALIVSAAGTTYALRRQKRDAHEQFRARMTEITSALINSMAIIHTAGQEPASAGRDAGVDVSSEVQRAAVYARQMDFLLTSDTEHLMTDVDYLTLAQAFASVGTDLGRLNLGWIHEQWARTEAQYGFTREAVTAAEGARSFYATVTDQHLKEEALARLRESVPASAGGPDHSLG